MTPLEVARDYTCRGWSVVPVAYKGKNPVAGKKWQELRLTEDDLQEHFNCKRHNIGVLLGDPSKLSDIDLDAPETRHMASHYLPKTDTIFGRKSAPTSHWLYELVTESAQFKDPCDGSTLVEIRSNTKKGTPCQTVFPGSVHPSGEKIEWVSDGRPSPIGEEDLRRSVMFLAAAALLSRHWPTGSRHSTSLALAGALRKAGWTKDQALDFLKPVLAGDEEYNDRIRCLEDTFAKSADEQLSGIPTLKTLIDPRVIDKVCEWLGLGGGEQSSDDWIEEMNERYMVVNEGGKTLVYRPTNDPILNRHFLEKITFEDLRKAYLNDRVRAGQRPNGSTIWKTKADAWLEHRSRRQFLGGVVFAPGQDLPADTINLWQGFALEPEKGDWSLLRDHIKWIISSGDDDLYEYMINWMARGVQDPGSQGEVALVFQGGRGTGKGTVANFYGRLFGQHFIYITNARHLTGNFNAHLRDAVVVFADEAFFAGDRSHASVLKGMVTDPLITIEAKYRNAVTARNVTHLILASNENWVIPAGVDERRFCVFDVSAARRGDHEYFKALHDQMENGGVAAMLHDLQNHDLSGFNVRVFPATEALIDQKVQSLRGPEAWLHDCLQQGKIGDSIWKEEGLTVLKEMTYSDYSERHKNFRDFAPQDIRSWAKKVRSILGTALQDHRPEKLGIRIRKLSFSPLHECRAAFSRYLSQDIIWETDDDGGSNT